MPNEKAASTARSIIYKLRFLLTTMPSLLNTFFYLSAWDHSIFSVVLNNKSDFFTFSAELSKILSVWIIFLLFFYSLLGYIFFSLEFLANYSFLKMKSRSSLSFGSLTFFTEESLNF